MANTVHVLSSLRMRWRLWSLRDLEASAPGPDGVQLGSVRERARSSGCDGSAACSLRRLRRPLTKLNGWCALPALLLSAEVAEGAAAEEEGDGNGGNTVTRCGWLNVWLCGETRTSSGCSNVLSSRMRASSSELPAPCEDGDPLFRQRPKAALICCCNPVMLLISVLLQSHSCTLLSTCLSGSNAKYKKIIITNVIINNRKL